MKGDIDAQGLARNVLLATDACRLMAKRGVDVSELSFRKEIILGRRDALTKAGCERLFEEKKSGKAVTKRPEFEVAFAYLRPELAPGWKPAVFRVDLINLLDDKFQIRDGSGIGVFAPQYGPRRGVFVGVPGVLSGVQPVGNSRDPPCSERQGVI